MDVAIRDVIAPSASPWECPHLHGFLTNFPALISKPLTVGNVQQGWGHPFDGLRKSCTRCTTWKSLSSKQALVIEQSIPSLTSITRLKGEVDDSDMQDKLSPPIDFDHWLEKDSGSVTKHGMPLEEQVLNRRRCVWINHNATTLRRRNREVRKQMTQEQRSADRAAKAQRTLEKKVQQGERKRVAEEKREAEEKKKQKKDSHVVSKPLMKTAAKISQVR